MRSVTQVSHEWWSTWIKNVRCDWQAFQSNPNATTADNLSRSLRTIKQGDCPARTDDEFNEVEDIYDRSAEMMIRLNLTASHRQSMAAKSYYAMLGQ